MAWIAASEDEPFDERAHVEAARFDAEAFAALYRHHLPAIHAFAYRRSRSRHIAEDVTAATFERALRNLHGFEWRDGGAEAMALSHRRQRARRPLPPRGATARP